MILVVGSTGLVGGMIARALLAGEREVRILVRPGSDDQPLVAAGARPVLGDLKDPASLVPALDGVDSVITTASAGSRGGIDTPRAVDLEGNQHLIDAARAAGIHHFIFISALAADEKSPAEVTRFKAHTEAYLRASGMPYTILAANGIIDVMLPLIVGGPIRAGKPVTLVGEGRRRHSFVSARDIAAFAVATINHPAAINQRLIVAGPEAFSWRDAIAAYEHELGQPVPVQQIEPGELVPNLPPLPGFAEFVSGLLAALETYDSPIDMTETARIFDVQLTGFTDFVHHDAARIKSAHASATV
jgi:NADH dehydrogenase